MQLVATFNSIEEMQAFAREILAKEEINTVAIKETVEAVNEEKPAPEKKKAPEKKADKGFKPIADTPEEEELPFGNEAAPKEEKTKAVATVSETELKTIFAKKVKAGKTAQIKALFAKYGVEKFSELVEKHPDKLTEIYNDVEAI